MEKLKDTLSKAGIAFLENEPLKKHTTFKIGGQARLFVMPSSVEEISFILKETNKADLPIFTLGRGSNVLFSDDGYNGVVMQLGKNFSRMEQLDETRLSSMSGAKLSAFCAFAQEVGLTGMEGLYGIPGTVGGGVYMNAGAYGTEMKDVIVSASYVTPTGEIGEFSKDEMELEYRHSVFIDNGYIITGVVVELEKGDPDKIKAAMDDYMGRRLDKQPLDYPSGGSTFKRPVGNYASALIDQCGLKGLSVGDAMVSPKHAGFVINTGNATCADVIGLVEKVRAEVLKQKGVELECEIKIIK